MHWKYTVCDLTAAQVTISIKQSFLKIICGTNRKYTLPHCECIFSSEGDVVLRTKYRERIKR